MHRADDGRWYYDDDTLVSDQSHTWSGAPNMYDYLTRDDSKSGTPSGTDVQTGTIPSTTETVDPLALSNAGLIPIFPAFSEKVFNAEISQDKT